MRGSQELSTFHFCGDDGNSRLRPAFEVVYAHTPASLHVSALTVPLQRTRFHYSADFGYEEKELSIVVALRSTLSTTTVKVEVDCIPPDKKPPGTPPREVVQVTRGTRNKDGKVIYTTVDKEVYIPPHHRYPSIALTHGT